MKKTICKGILGLFILVFTVGVINVYAVDNSTPSIREAEKSDNKCDELEKVPREEWTVRYAVNIDIINEGYKVSIDGSKLPSDLNKDSIKNKMKFKLTEIKYYSDYDVEDVSETLIKYEYNYTGYSVTTGLDGYITGNNTLTVKDSVLISKDKLSPPEGGGVEFTFTPVEQFDPILKDCNPELRLKAVYLVADTLSKEKDPEEFSYGSGDSSSGSYVWTDCTNYASNYKPEEFEYKFCYAKEKAEADINSGKRILYTFEPNKKWPNLTDTTKLAETKTLQFKCDYNKFVKNTTEEEGNPNYDYYTNKEYILGKSTITKTDKYNYKTEKENKSVETSCDVECEEVVTVEYGPPIASKAGYCIEYKVKVTSRVNCKMTKEPTPPTPAIVCTPTPQCKHSWGIVDRGGPSDEFDECVSTCDNGKYTDKCVNKCYKQVYQSEAALRQSSNAILTYETKTVGYIKKGDNQYIYNNGTILWSNGTKTRTDSKSYTYSNGTGRDNNDSYYHQTTSWGRKDKKYNYYIRYQNGIPTTKGCKASCYWIENKSGDCGKDTKIKYYNHPDVFDKYYGADGKETSVDGFNASCNSSSVHKCGSYNNQYYDKDGNPVSKKDYELSCATNPTRVCVKTIESQIEKDMEANQEKYENLKKECQAAASCNTTQAEFTISVDYTTKNDNKKTTIYFPYTGNNEKDAKDTIEYSDQTKQTQCTKENKNSTILSSSGCYNCGETTSNKMYMTEWSFPGTWINSKSGKITYNPDSANETTWRSIKDKFCFPMNIKDTNAKWYNYYESKVNGSDESYSYNDPNYEITCPNGTKLTNTCDYKNTTFTPEDAKELEYNINATARHFGMFEWDIDISCFYAVNSIFPKEKESDKCETTCVKDDKVTIRSVDLKNLFPDSEGNSLTASTETGRTPGFNWSEYATQTNKDEDYKSAPSAYTKWVQAKGYSVYDEDHLDYEINLTKDAINQIKKQFNSNIKQYTSWEGDVEINSVTNYQSPLLRNGGILSKNSKIPSVQALKCNNIKNYSSDECEDFSEEGK